MPASSSEAKARWKKQKTDYRAARKSKQKEHDTDDAFEDNEDDDGPDLDPPYNHPEAEDDLPGQRVDRASQQMGEKEGEKMVGGGSRICEFPVVIQRQVIRPHSSVFGIVEAERAARNVDSIGHGQSGVALLENISHGQLQALSAVPRDSPALLGAQLEETASGSDIEFCVIKPPRIISGSGVIKRLGSAGRLHVVPVHSDWFSPNSVHRLERQVVPHFFFGKKAVHTPEKYMECRNFIVAKYMENPKKHLLVSDCQGLVADIDNVDLIRIVKFLDSWGIINYCTTPLKHEGQKESAYLYEDSNSELHVPLAALKFADSLIKFDKPTCRLKASDVYPELACQLDEDPDIDSNIREKLSEVRCSCCSRSIPTVYYQSQKEVEVRLCLDCYHEGGFVTGHSSLDFAKEKSLKDYGDADGYSWSDQETLLLLDGIQMYNENWNKIAEHVGSKSKAHCIAHFISLPVDVAVLENIDVPSTSGSSKFWSHDGHDRTEPNSNGYCLPGDDTKSNFLFSDCENPVMSLVAFLASVLGPRVAAACAHASLASLCKDIDKEQGSSGGINSSSKNGPLSQHDAKDVQLSTEKVIAAAKDGLTAAALKAKLFADHEEREIQRLSANIINNQLKRLELKLKQFAEVETMLMRECEQMERTRQRIAAEKALMISAQFGSSSGVPQATNLPGISNSIMHNNTSGISRQQISGPQSSLVSGYSNSQLMHPQMPIMQPQGMYGLGPRLPLSTIHPPPSTSNAMFGSFSNSQQPLGHPMLRPSFSGTNPDLG